MKNSIKIQTEIMKHIKKYSEGRERRNATYSVTTINGRDKIIVTTDTNRAFCFDSWDFYLNTSKMYEMDGLKTFFDEKTLNKQEPIAPTGVTKRLTKGKAVEFENKNFKVYVDEKLIKEFGKVDDLWFAGKGEVKPVYVYEGENLVGLIMPMKMPKNKD